MGFKIGFRLPFYGAAGVLINFFEKSSNKILSV
ncbi:hypothetical protein SAMN05216364_100120 [Porphyromonadaceae bacterium KHP3R9]|jgi:hypothetical protein|nr:hypothetical protein SAMN05216364_100120 [Porphyromonadaceae bacterium KHP3R9]